MEKLDHDLIEDVRISAIDQRLEALRRGNPEEQQAFFRELSRITGTFVDNVEPTSFRERVAGYESFVLWAAFSVLLFLVTRYWADVRDFLFQASQAVVQTSNQVAINSIDFERLRAFTYELYANPATQEAILELINRGEAG